MIGVGNLSVGGSGKSPMVMYLADYLAKNFRTGVLSRGYGKKTKGYGIVNYDSNFKWWVMKPCNSSKDLKQI